MWDGGPVPASGRSQWEEEVTSGCYDCLNKGHTPHLEIGRGARRDTEKLKARPPSRGSIRGHNQEDTIIQMGVVHRAPKDGQETQFSPHLL